MTDSENLYFELLNSGNLVRLEPIEFIRFDSEIDWDKNWIKTKVSVKGGKFEGQYSGDFMTVDFEKFKQELTRLYNDLKGSTYFYDLEGFIELKIKGDGIGHFEVDVKACDKPGANASELTYTMMFDQTEIPKLLNQLDRITKRFPINGDFKIKNE